MNVGVLRLRRIIRFADDVAPLRMTRAFGVFGIENNLVATGHLELELIYGA